LATVKTVVQCDFDGTVTFEDVSFAMLDAFARGDWRLLLHDYESGRITVGQFNREAFALVKVDRETLMGAVKDRVKMRPGLHRLVAACRRRGFRFVVISNGLDFYIKEILERLGLGDIEVFAAETTFHPGGVSVRYVGPDGSVLDQDFKAAYVDFFVREGYRVVYIGNGASDMVPAKRCQYVFATGQLLADCQRENLDCTPFEDFNEVASVIES